MDEVNQAISQLLAYMKSISEAPDVGKAALEATKGRMALCSGPMTCTPFTGKN
jgi:type VI secretion system protein ImpL